MKLDADLPSESPEGEEMQPPQSSLREEIASLRQLINAILVILLIITASAAVRSFMQLRDLDRQLAVVRREVLPMITSYQKNEEPMITGFIQKLQGFARAHPDFNPVLQRHNLAVPPAAPAPAR